MCVYLFDCEALFDRDNSPNSQDKVQIYCANIYLVRFLVNFVVVCVCFLYEFCWILQINLKFAALQPPKISEALHKVLSYLQCCSLDLHACNKLVTLSASCLNNRQVQQHFKGLLSVINRQLPVLAVTGISGYGPYTSVRYQWIHGMDTCIFWNCTLKIVLIRIINLFFFQCRVDQDLLDYRV